jgi:hypothetical protein
MRQFKPGDIVNQKWSLDLGPVIIIKPTTNTRFKVKFVNNKLNDGTVCATRCEDGYEFAANWFTDLVERKPRKDPRPEWF